MLVVDVLSIIFDYIVDGFTYKSILYASKTFNHVMTHYYPSKRYQVYNQLWSLVKLYPNEAWDWPGISSNALITMNIIKKNPDNPWYIMCFGKNPNITVEYAKEYANGVVMNLSENKSVTMNMITNNPTIPWHWGCVSRNPNLTMEMIENNPDKNWDWDWISANPGITMDIIENNPTKPWKWWWVSLNPNITTDFLLKHIDNNNNNWCWSNLSYNPGITIEFIIKVQKEIRLGSTIILC